MKLTVYIDVLVATNMIINYFLIKITSALSGAVAKQNRIIISSFVGALFSFSILFNISYLTSFIVKIISVFICSRIAFGVKTKRQYFKNTILLSVATFLFSGIVSALFASNTTVYTRNFCIYPNISPLLLVTCIVFTYISVQLFEFVFTTGRKEYFYRADIFYNDNSTTTTAFYDTGFNVKDIVTFRKVLISDLNTVKNILPEDLLTDIVFYYKTGDYTNKNIIPVFYSSINRNGMLPAIVPQKIIVHGNKNITELKDVIIAIAPEQFSADYQVIFGKDIYKLTGE